MYNCSMNCHCNNQEVNATIQKMEKTCSAWAVIPSYTVPTIDNLKGLHNAFVHVSSVNTTFYIDNQLRRIITWKGPVFTENYDYENNPLNLVGQIVYDSATNNIIIYNQTGGYYIIKNPDVNLLEVYTPEPTATDTYNASYINSRLNATKVILGSDASARNTSNAIGYGASTGTNTYSTAIGMGTRTTRNYEFSVGGGSSVSTCYVSNVRAGELDTDAVNVGQLNSSLSGINHDIENLTELINSGSITDEERVKLNGLLDIKSIDSTLSLNEEGQLSVVSGGANSSTSDSQFTEMEVTRVKNLPPAVVTGFEDTTYGTDSITMHLDTKDLATGGVSVQELMLQPATPATSGATGSAGIMSITQATQLQALAEAYQAEEKGTVLYEGTASTNNIELSESGLAYDHLIVVAEYMGMGSFALEQQVSEVFYPTDSIKSFQMNATDITTGNTPTVELVQDIWSITDDGMELELVSSLKAAVNSETTVTPDTTSNFTITKVVGFGKKVI